jgi:hypothetical protein
MRTPWRAAIVIAVAFAVAGCSSGTSTSPNATTAPTAPVSPSTVLDPSPGVTVPFTADNGALTVTAGPAPDNVTQDQAVSITNNLLGAHSPTAQILSAVSGLVTFGPGLTADTVSGQPAWVIVYRRDGVVACPAMPTTATAPTTASNLQAMIVLGPPTPAGEDIRQTPPPVYDYRGAGIGLCGPAEAPRVLALFDIYNGQL